MARPGQPSSGEFVELPDGEWLLCQIEKHEVYTDTYDPAKPKQRVKVWFDVLDDEYEGGKFLYWAGFSLHEKSKLTPLAKAVSGLSGDELFEEFDTTMLDGAKVRVLGENKTKDDKTFFTPTMFKSAKSGKAAAAKVKKAEPEDDGEDIDI